MRTLTYSAFLSLLAKGGARPVGILALTDAKAKKTNNPFGAVSKLSYSVGFVGANYEKAVQKEGTARQGAYDADGFQADSLPWGQWVKGLENRVISHNGKLYLRTQSTPGQRKHQAARVLAYIAQGGGKLSFKDVAPFLPAKRESAKQSAVGMVGEDRQVSVKNFAFDSIQIVKINGEKYRLMPDATT